MAVANWQFDKILVWVGSDPSQMTARTLRDAVDGFVRGAMRYGVLADEDLPEEALLSAALSVYDGQVCNGGHWQFAVNTRMPPALMDRVARCLEAIGVEEQAAIFREFRALMAASASQLPPIEGLSDHKARPEGLDELNRRFFTVRERSRLWEAHLAWLRGTGCLRYATHWEEPEQACATAINAHPAYLARRDEIEALRAADKEAIEAAGRRRRERTTRFLCDAAGVKVLGIYAALPGKIPETKLVPVLTAGGRRFVQFEGLTATLMTETLRPTGFSCSYFNELNNVPLGARVRRFVRRLFA